MTEQSPRMTWPYPKADTDLRGLYSLGWSCDRIGKHTGVSASTVNRRLMKLGVPRRNPVDIQKSRRTWDVDQAVRSYTEGSSAKQIAEKAGVTKRVILVELRRRGLTRPRGQRPGWLGEVIRRYQEGESVPEIAPNFGSSTSLIYSWFKRSGVKTRCGGKSLYGKSNPNWNGGVSFLPYPHVFNKELKRKIRTRDGFRCVACGLPEKTHRKMYPKANGVSGGQALAVHHIDYDKANCRESNLVCLCHTCNSRANTNKEMCRSMFESYLSKKGVI